MFRLDKRKIFLLYQYYLLGQAGKVAVLDSQIIARQEWYTRCLACETYLREKITTYLKEDWQFAALPPLEKAILIFAAYELVEGEKKALALPIIDQTINFSKVYLTADKFKYVNKVLDRLWKSLNNFN